MAAEIKINVDLDGGAFDAFRAKFQDYAAKLDATPGAMAKVSRSSEESVVHFAALAAALSDQADAIGKIASGSTTLRQNTEVTARHWQDLRLSTQGVAQNIKEATASFLKWSGITALIGGITGGIAAYGFSNIAESVSGGRTAAMGVGATYGGRASFLTNFGRLPDAEGFLSRINAAQTDPNKGVALRVLGLTGANATGDSADVGANAILQLKKLVGTKGDGFDERFLADKLHANRADELIDVNFAQTLRGMSPKEVDDRVAAYRAAKPKLALGEDSQKKYQDFMTRMKESGNRIENTFVKNLANLTPGMTKLATSFARVADVLMQKDGPMSQWLGKLNEGVEWLAENVDTPEFQGKVEWLVKGMVQVAEATSSLGSSIDAFAKWFGITPGAASEGPHGTGPRATGGIGGVTGLRAAAAERAGGGGLGGGGGGGGGGAGGGGFMDALAGIESSNRNVYSTVDPDVAGPGTRSQGFFQINTPTWQQFAPRAGVDLSQYPNAMSAPKDVQAKVAAQIPFGRFGPRTRRMMQQRFGPLDPHRTVGELGKGHEGAAAPAAPGRPKDDRWKKTAGPGAGERDLFAEKPTNRAPAPRVPSNTHTRVTITKPTGADPSTSAAASVPN